MDKCDEFQTSKTLGEAALAAMIRHNVPPTPRNYMLWYAHIAGGAPELSRTIEILISNGQEFTNERNEELFRRFSAMQPASLLVQTSEQLQQAVSQVLGHLEEASGNAKAYGKTLTSYSNQLNERPSLERLPEIVGGLLAETQLVAERNQLLETQLSQSSGEIRQLRQDLAAVQREAMTDALTGIANRKFFEERLREAAGEAMESGEPLSLLFIDIDHFKRFNDRYGHQHGDQVLRLVAKTLTDSVKGRDTTARYGGEEFVIVLPQTRLADALRLADQIRKTMMGRRVVGKNSGEDYGNITLSIGVSHYVPGEPLIDMVRRADAALYCAKRSGRNRVASEAEAQQTDAAIKAAS